jgi:hypothetical protein
MQPGRLIVILAENYTDATPASEPVAPASLHPVT